MSVRWKSAHLGGTVHLTGPAHLIWTTLWFQNDSIDLAYLTNDSRSESLYTYSFTPTLCAVSAGIFQFLTPLFVLYPLVYFSFSHLFVLYLLVYFSFQHLIFVHSPLVYYCFWRLLFVLYLFVYFSFSHLCLHSIRWYISVFPTSLCSICWYILVFNTWSLCTLRWYITVFGAYSLCSICSYILVFHTYVCTLSVGIF